MEGFTKGPWVAVDKRPHSDGISIFSGEQYIAFVGDSDGVTNYKENANLIAAAPELLEVCLRIQAQFSQAGVASVAGSLNPAEDSAAQIDAAIKKALGQ